MILGEPTVTSLTYPHYPQPEGALLDSSTRTVLLFCITFSTLNPLINYKRQKHHSVSERVAMFQYHPDFGRAAFCRLIVFYFIPFIYAAVYSNDTDTMDWYYEPIVDIESNISNFILAISNHHLVDHILQGKLREHIFSVRKRCFPVLWFDFVYL